MQKHLMIPCLLHCPIQCPIFSRMFQPVLSQEGPLTHSALSPEAPRPAHLPAGLRSLQQQLPFSNTFPTATLATVR